MNSKFVPALRFERLTGVFDPFIKLTMPENAFKTTLINQSNIAEYHKVLDFGCGTATLTFLIKQYCPQAFVEGVDVDPKILKIARKKAESKMIDVNLRLYDGHDLSYPDGFFDRVVSSLVFHHLMSDQKRHTIKEIHRILKHSGEIHIADFGKAENMLMRGAFWVAQCFEGFETTRDNVNGMLPQYLQEAGFIDVRETEKFSTIFGTLSLYSAKK